ncbi:MAG TPA: hypothetical protein VN132_01035 [Bdellovibrio sp.]|nr:hypothetical protein [Bdellovibrio sp.]
MKVISTLVVLVSLCSSLANASLVKYRSCQQADRERVELYTELVITSEDRKSFLTLNNFAYTGTANKTLTEFVSDDGRIHVTFELKQTSNPLINGSAEVTGPNFQIKFDQCFRTDLGSGSVSVHN